MTLLEKQGPSTAYPLDHEHDHDGAYDHSGQKGPSAFPPSYDDTVGAQREGQPSTSRASGLPPSNYVDMLENHGSIKGTWDLDTRLEVPQALLRPLTDDKLQRPNLKLQARHGTVQAAVALLGPSNQRANIELETAHGKVVFKLLSRAYGQPFKLNAKTHHGSVTIGLPKDFVGPLRYSIRHGKVKFSEVLQPQVATFTNESSFVGDWQAAKFVDHESWQGDTVEVSVGHGTIHFDIAQDVEVEPTEDNGSRRRHRSRSRDRCRDKDNERVLTKRPPKDRGGWFGRRKREME